MTFARRSTRPRLRGKSTTSSRVRRSRGEACMRAAGVDTKALLAPVPAIDAYLAQLLGELAIPQCLKSAVEYAVLGNGKRMRPLLAWHCCAATGAPGEASLAAGVA